MTSVSLNGVAGLLGAPLTMALDAGSQVPGGSPQGVASEALDGFQKLLAQHINNINKKLQLAENKELNINFSMENHILNDRIVVPDVIGPFALFPNRFSRRTQCCVDTVKTRTKRHHG